MGNVVMWWSYQQSIALWYLVRAILEKCNNVCNVFIKAQILCC